MCHPQEMQKLRNQWTVVSEGSWPRVLQPQQKCHSAYTGKSKYHWNWWGQGSKINSSYKGHVTAASHIEELYGSHAYFQIIFMKTCSSGSIFWACECKATHAQMTLSDGHTRKLARVSLFRGSQGPPKECKKSVILWSLFTTWHQVP